MTQPTADTPSPGRRRGLAGPGGAAGLFLLALLLRAWGLNWGLPGEHRYYPYHPDEAVLLAAICNTNPLWGDFTPEFYNYGSFQILLTRLVYDLSGPLLGAGPVPRFDLPFPQWAGDFGRLLLSGRWLAVLMGAGTVPVVVALGRRVAGPGCGWLAGLFLAVAPGPVVLGHYLAVDVPSAFLSTLAILLGAAALGEKSERRFAGLVVGAFVAAGLAAGTKYNTALAGAAVLVPLVCRWRDGAPVGRLIALLAAGILAFGAAFLLSTPGALLDGERFREHLLYELGRNREGQGLVFQGTPPAALYHLGISLPITLEWPLFLLCLGGVGWALARRTTERWMLLLFLLPSFLALATAERKFVRYVIPLLPPLIVLGAGALSDLSRIRGRGVRALAAGAALATVAGAAGSSIAHLGLFTAPDSRDRAADWLRSHAGPADLVALGADPWYYTPPLHPSAGSVKVLLPFGGPPVWDRPGGEGLALWQGDRFRVLAPRSVPPQGPLPVEELRRRRPRYVVLTDYETEDPERIRRADPGFRHGILDLLEALAAEYVLAAEFRPRPALGPLRWWSRGIPPHDWRYPMPGIRIYARRE